jgi:hypothetical protein
MKKLLLAVLVFFCGPRVRAQMQVPSFPSDPATCDPTRGLMYYNTTLNVMKYCQSLNTWIPIAGIPPNSPGIPSTNGPGMIFASNYGVKGDAKNNCYATITNTSNVVTVQQPGATFTSADVGDIFFGTNGGCDGNFGSRNGTVLIKGFICSLNSPTSVNIGITFPGCAAANATGTCTGNPASAAQCPINWGPRDDTANLNTFFAAVTNFFATTPLPTCGDGWLPDGRILVSAAIKSRAQFCGTNGAPNGQTSFWSWSVHGSSPGGTVFVPLPAFDASTCVTACFFDTPDTSVTGSSVHDFVVDGGGNGTVTNGSAKCAFASFYTISMWNLNVMSWGNSGANNFTAYCLVGAYGSWMDIHGLHAYNGGFRCATLTNIELYHLDCVDPVGVTVNGSGAQNFTSTNQSNIICQDTFAEGGCVQVVSGAVWHSKDDNIVDFANPGSMIECGGTCVIDGDYINCQGSAGCHGISMNDETDSNPGIVYLKNTNYAVSGGVPITDGVAGSQLFDECGNINFFTNSVWTNISYISCPVGPAITPAPALPTGTGACATITTQVPAATSAGGYAGSFKCTGVTGASTMTIAFGYTAPNGWSCNASDETTVADKPNQTSTTTTTCVLTTVATAANDVIAWSAAPY